MKKFALGGLLFALFTLLALFVRSGLGSVAAQTTTTTPPPAQLAAVPMADGLQIKGDYYPAPESDTPAPAALLLHQNAGSGFDWRPFALSLQATGYSVLAVDMRGHGLTGGSVNWRLAESDAGALMEWLRQQPAIDPDRVAIVGASIGANLALRVCSADAACHAVIALSPGINYFGVRTPEAIRAMEDKSVFLVAGQRDNQSSLPTKELTAAVPRSVNLMTRLYGSARQHGTGLFFFSDLTPLMLSWLDQYNQGA
jgi:pimeloyl-ACP methyl ester carboxylesterase